MARTTRKSAPVAAPLIDIGISARDREKIADSLAHVLADTYTLYLKTHAFHWNVEGPMFKCAAPDVHGAVHRVVECA